MSIKMQAILGILSLGLLLTTVIATDVPDPDKIGFSEEMGPDKDALEVVAPLGGPIKTLALATLAKSGANVDTVAFNNAPVEVLRYFTQVAAGKNFFVKIRIATFVFHVRIYQHWSNTLELSKLIGPKQESDKLFYFECDDFTGCIKPNDG